MSRRLFFILLLALISCALISCAGMKPILGKSPIVFAGMMRCSVAFNLRANRKVEFFGLSVCKELIQQFFGEERPKPKTRDY